MLGLGWPEVAVVLVVALLIFGPKKIPEIGGAFGKTLKGFKDEISGTPDDDLIDGYDEEDA
ncbi:MAG: twin-arginine translocase TatA/TatE family subunit [Elainellaceae cyanobacterium]